MARYGTGTVQHLGGDRYRLWVSAGTDPVTGKRKRASKVITATSKKAANQALGDFAKEDHGKRDTITLSTLLDDYLAHAELSPSTAVDFEGYARRHIKPTLGKKKLGALTARDLDALYSHLSKQGGVGGTPLAPATVRRVHVIIRAALERACDWEYIAANPAARAHPPKVSQTEVELPPAAHLVAFLAAIDDMPLDGPGMRDTPPLPDFVALLLETGARPGELCALPWGDVDFAVGRVRIDQNLARAKGGTVIKDTKTHKGRSVSLSPAVLDVLSARQARWKPAALTAGVPLADLPVFPSTKAEKPWRPDSISREFREVRDSLNLSESLTMRNLRHYCVSVLRDSGVDVLVAAKRMGHSPTVMLEVYSHVLGEADRDAASALAANLEKVRKG